MLFLFCTIIWEILLIVYLLYKKFQKNKICDLYIQSEKKIPAHDQSKDHPFGNVYLTEKSIQKILPLLKTKTFLEN